MSLRRLLWAGAVALAAVLGAGCTGLPAQVQPVGGFELNRYLGTWHEIARLDHSFERGLSQVSAQYSLRDDGGVRVINRGFDAAKGTWKQAEGKAYFVGAADTAHLKVSFFGPFYGDYWVMDHAEDYQWSIVGEPSGRYLWVLSRDARPADAVKAMLRRRVEELGYDWSLVRETRQ